MTKNAVELRNVSFTYAGFDASAIDDASFAVAPGECVVLCGEPGCGKTTATRIVNGLAGGFYEGSRTGKVLVAGRDIDDLEDWELSSLTGSVFQNPRTQFFNLDTTGEIAFGMENLGVPREEMHRRMRGVVRELGMERLMGRGIFELSGARCNRWRSRAHGPAGRASTSSTSRRAIWILPPWRSSPPSSRKPSRAGLP